MNLDGVMLNPQDDYLRPTMVERSYQQSRAAMAEAADAVHDFTETVAMPPEERKRLDGIHKAMRRIIREWNKLEQVTGRPGAPTLPD